MFVGVILRPQFVCVMPQVVGVILKTQFGFVILKHRYFCVTLKP